MEKIICIQHTQAVHHVAGLVGSWMDYDLTELGKNRAQCIGRNLYSELRGARVAVFSSDLQRALHTVQPLADLLGVPVLIRKELRERNLGRAAGRPVAWLNDHAERKEESVDDRMFPEAESRRDLFLRLKPFYGEILEREEEIAVVASHCDTLSVFCALCLGLDLDRIDCAYIREHLQGKAGGVTVLNRRDGPFFEMERLSDLSYQEARK